MFALILSVAGLLGYVGLVVATVIRKQHVYAFAFLISIAWVVFALVNVPGLIRCF